MQKRTRWKSVIGYDGTYQVSDTGLVRRVRKHGDLKTTRLLKPYKNQRGYTKVELFKLGKGQEFFVHCLVMHAFVGQIPSGLQINHKDGVKFNNNLNNLEYVTPKQNMRHSFDVLGRKGVCGERCFSAKLDNQKVVEIKISLSEDTKISELARKYDVSKTAIRSIKNGITWKHISI